MNAYWLTGLEESTDAMLAPLMKEVAEDHINNINVCYHTKELKQLIQKD